MHQCPQHAHSWCTKITFMEFMGGYSWLFCKILQDSVRMQMMQTHEDLSHRQLLGSSLHHLCLALHMFWHSPPQDGGLPAAEGTNHGHRPVNTACLWPPKPVTSGHRSFIASCKSIVVSSRLVEQPICSPRRMASSYKTSWA